MPRTMVDAKDRMVNKRELLLHLLVHLENFFLLINLSPDDLINTIPCIDIVTNSQLSLN